MNIIRKIILLVSRWVIVVTAMFTMVSQTLGANGTWINTSGGAWSASGNWSGGIMANGTDAIADFSTLALSGDAYVNNDTPPTVGTLRFGDTTASHDWYLTNSTLTLATSSGIPTINVSNRTATIGSVLAGTQGLVKTGAGILAIDQGNSAGINTYSGGTYVRSGTLMFGTRDQGWCDQLLGTGTVYLGDTNGSADVVLTSPNAQVSLPLPIVIVSGNAGTIRIAGCPGRYFITGGVITLGSDNSSGKGVTLSDGARIDGGIRDPAGMTPGTGGGVTIDGSAGIWYDTGAYTYTGPTVINGGSYLRFNGGGCVIPSTSAVTVNGVMDLSGQSFTIGSLAGTGTVDSIADTVATSQTTLTVGNDNTSTTFAGIIQNTTGTNSLTKIGTGTLTLVGVNSYSGATTVNGGTLKVVSSAGNLPSGTAVSVGISGATLEIPNNVVQTIGSLAGAAGSIVTNNGTLTAGTDNRSQTFAGVIAGAGSFTKTGTGTLTLLGTNTYSGTTTINGGKLTLGAGAAIGVASYATANAYTFSPASGNLLAGLSPSFTNNAAAGSEGSGPVEVLTDGVVADDMSTRYTIGDNAVLVYTLAPANQGCNITRINFYTGWGDPNRVNISLTSISYSMVGDPNTFIVIPNSAVYYNAGTSKAFASLTASGGVLALNVYAIRFNFGGQDYGYVGYKELEVCAEAAGVQYGALQNSTSVNLANSGAVLELAHSDCLSGNTEVYMVTGTTIDLTGTNMVRALYLNGLSQPAGLYNTGSPATTGYLSGTGFLNVLGTEHGIVLTFF